MAIDLTQLKSDVLSWITLIVGWALGMITFVWKGSARLTRIELLLSESMKDILVMQQKLIEHDRWEHDILTARQNRRVYRGDNELHDSTKG